MLDTGNLRPLRFLDEETWYCVVPHCFYRPRIPSTLSQNFLRLNWHTLLESSPTQSLHPDFLSRYFSNDKLLPTPHKRPQLPPLSPPLPTIHIPAPQSPISPNHHSKPHPHPPTAPQHDPTAPRTISPPQSHRPNASSTTPPSPLHRRHNAPDSQYIFRSRQRPGVNQASLMQLFTSFFFPIGFSPIVSPALRELPCLDSDRCKT